VPSRSYSSSHTAPIPTPITVSKETYSSVKRDLLLLMRIGPDTARRRGRENSAYIYITRGVHESRKIDDLDGYASGIELPLSDSPEQDVFPRSRPTAHELLAVPQVFHLALQSISSPGLVVVWLCVRVCVGVCVCVCVCVRLCRNMISIHACGACSFAKVVRGERR
jgi:hypothetical protein